MTFASTCLDVQTRRREHLLDTATTVPLPSSSELTSHRRQLLIVFLPTHAFDRLLKSLTRFEYHLSYSGSTSTMDLHLLLHPL